MKYLVFLFLLLSSIECFSQKEGTFGQMEINLPVRITHTLGVSGSMGWNGLVGIGPTIQYYISPHFGLDGGIGLALSGFKFGGRLRYLFLEKNFTPLIGVGYIYSTGSPSSYLEFEESNGNIFVIQILPTSFIQIIGGFEVVANNGFFVMGNLGYAIQTKDNVELISGNPSPDSERSLQILYGGGIVIEFGIGYIFSNKKGFKGKF